MSVGAGAPLGPQTGVAAWTGLGHCPRGGGLCSPPDVPQSRGWRRRERRQRRLGHAQLWLCPRPRGRRGEMGRPSRSEVSQFLSSRPRPTQVSQPEAVASKGPRCSHPGHRCLRPTNLQCTCCVGRAEGRPPRGAAGNHPPFRSTHGHGGPWGLPSWWGQSQACSRTGGPEQDLTPRVAGEEVHPDSGSLAPRPPAPPKTACGLCQDKSFHNRDSVSTPRALMCEVRGRGSGSGHGCCCLE